jgi:rubrerythrin
VSAGSGFSTAAGATAVEAGTGVAGAGVVAGAGAGAAVGAGAGFGPGSFFGMSSVYSSQPGQPALAGAASAMHAAIATARIDRTLEYRVIPPGTPSRMSDQRSGTPGREEAVPRLTRKGLLATAGAGLAAVATVPGCGGEGGEGDREADVKLLNEALKLEYGAVILYRESSERFGGNVGQTATLFASQAAEHVEVLSEAVEARGGTPLERPSRRQRRRGLRAAQVDATADFLSVALRLENTAVAGYTQVVGELGAPELRRMFYELAENSAARLSVLLGLAGEVQVPDALTTGQPV